MVTAAIAALMPIAGCHGSSAESGVSSYPPAIQRACAVMAERCSKCHSPDRVNVVQAAEPRGWELLVRRMRLMPGSGISLVDEDTVVRCIVYRKLGFDPARGRKGERS